MQKMKFAKMILIIFVNISGKNMQICVLVVLHNYKGIVLNENENKIKNIKYRIKYNKRIKPDAKKSKFS